MREDFFDKLVDTGKIYWTRNTDTRWEDILTPFMNKYEPFDFKDTLTYVSSNWSENCFVKAIVDVEPEEVDIDEFERVLSRG
ncbi:MAG: hypothetical protein IKI94_13135 [Ruminococcus sp.]|nr:hypothetical protein [Ruminococcus sp.]